MFEVFTWRVSDCEELVGVLLGGYNDCEGFRWGSQSHN